MKTIILYHANCGDGFGAAWAAWKKLGKHAEYIPVAHGEPPPTGLRGNKVYIIDFSYPVELMEGILKKAHKVIALDHHISAEHSTKLADEYVYDLSHSGAVLAWRYFHPKKTTPRLLRHIEDIDLWKFKLPKTREIAAYINSKPATFDAWSGFARALERTSSRAKIIAEGEAIVRYQKEMIRHAVERAELVLFEGHTVFAVNATSLVSEIGNALVKKHPPFAIMWSERRGRIVVSLRSNKRTDVSVIAAQYGGGGHKQSSGFSFPAHKPFPWTQTHIKNQIEKSGLRPKRRRTP